MIHYPSSAPTIMKLISSLIHTQETIFQENNTETKENIIFDFVTDSGKTSITIYLNKLSLESLWCALDLLLSARKILSRLLNALAESKLWIKWRITDLH